MLAILMFMQIVPSGDKLPEEVGFPGM